MKFTGNLLNGFLSQDTGIVAIAQTILLSQEPRSEPCLTKLVHFFIRWLSKRCRFLRRHAIYISFIIPLQGAKGFYDQLLISASLFWILIRRSNTANLVRNLVYIILAQSRKHRPNLVNSPEVQNMSESVVIINQKRINHSQKYQIRN